MSRDAHVEGEVTVFASGTYSVWENINIQRFVLSLACDPTLYTSSNVLHICARSKSSDPTLYMENM